DRDGEDPAVSGGGLGRAALRRDAERRAPLAARGPDYPGRPHRGRDFPVRPGDCGGTTAGARGAPGGSCRRSRPASRL
ncbi:MAG: hypothetical protein AVDCRST_MAG88-2735, partial [uncultured Thermomicrobiales bacterium]